MSKFVDSEHIRNNIAVSNIIIRYLEINMHSTHIIVLIKQISL